MHWTRRRPMEDFKQEIGFRFFQAEVRTNSEVLIHLL